MSADRPFPAYSCKIGGKPAVPSDFVWPGYLSKSFDGVTKERPFSFMSQINLEDFLYTFDSAGTKLSKIKISNCPLILSSSSALFTVQAAAIHP